jgi:hypothetical protein
MPTFRAALEYVYETVPAMRPAMTAVNRAIKTPTFTGWGMSNHHALPWDDEQDWAHFRAAADHVRDRFEHGLKKDTAVTPGNVDTLKWRHWIAAYSARYACTFAAGPVTMVECGVGDGLTAFFACEEAEHLGRPYAMHCYDAWAEVATDVSRQNYADLALERTQRNLSRFNVTYHPGLIPASLEKGAPEMVDYLSIDLNAAEPTIDALRFFLPRLSQRGVILFDDYAFDAYEDTRRAIDEFFAGRPGSLMKVPTGQAIWYA